MKSLLLATLLICAFSAPALAADSNSKIIMNNRIEGMLAEMVNILESNYIKSVKCQDLEKLQRRMESFYLECDSYNKARIREARKNVDDFCKR